MDFNQTRTVVRGEESLLATNTVLRNTYLLLSLTLLFSALMAWSGIMIHAKPSILLFFLGAYGLMFLTQALRNSVWGLVSTFAFTGFMGYMLAPTLSMFLRNYVNGGELILTALGGTGLTFLGLSGFVLTTRKDFSFLQNFLFIGAIVLVLAIIANLFLQMPVMQLALSAAFILFSSAMILFETSRIIHGGERNYIMATISLYVSIYNLFLSLLMLLGIFQGRE